MIISLFLEWQTGKISRIFAYCPIFSSSDPFFSLLSQIISTLYFPITHSREDPEYSKIHTDFYYKSRGQCQTKSNLGCNTLILPRRQDLLCSCFFLLSSYKYSAISCAINHLTCSTPEVAATTASVYQLYMLQNISGAIKYKV